MDGATSAGDWAPALQDQYAGEVARLDAAGALTAPERSRLLQVLAAPVRHVYRLGLAPPDGPVSELAGYLLVTRGLLPAFLFSPVAGLEKIDDGQGLQAVLARRLADPRRRAELLRFVPIEVRAGLSNARTLTLQWISLPLATPVFATLQQTIMDLRHHNLELLRERLLGLPTLRDLLDGQLKEQLDREFQGLDLSPLGTRVNSYAPAAPGQEPRRLSSMTLAQAALRYLARGPWPASEVREYLSPSVPFVQAQAQSATLDARMQACVQAAVRSLPGVIAGQLDGFWSLPREGLSLRAIARQVMVDRFFHELMQARYRARVDGMQFRELLALCDQVPPTGPWQCTRLALRGPGDVAMELAGVFDISVPGSAGPVFLFSGRAGLERFAHGVELKDSVLERLRDDREITSLLSHVSRDQQALLRTLPQGVFEAEVIAGELFEDRVQSVIDKQVRDVQFLLNLVRHTELDVNAVLEHGLDVRWLLHPGLMALSTQGRWSTALALERSVTPALDPLPDTRALAEMVNRLQVLAGQVALLQVARPDLRNPARSGEGFGQQVRAFYSAAVTAGLSRLRGSALRYEVQVKRGTGQLDEVRARLVSAVLDRPVRSGRHALNGFAPDVCELSLMLHGQRRVIVLGNCFVITERGGTDADNSGCALLWTGTRGLEPFNSLPACLDGLQGRLLDKTGQWALLDCIALARRAAVLEALEQAPQAVTWVPTVIDTHWLDACQRGLVEKHINDIEFLMQQGTVSHMSAQSLARRVARYWSEQAGFYIEGVEDELRDWLFNERLPDWLKHARPGERQEYAAIMLRYRQAGAGVEDYSRGVPPLLDYAREQLRARLQADFPGLALDPDEIEISVVQYSAPAGANIAGPAAVSRLAGSLTHFALSNFFNVQSGLRSYRSLGPHPLPVGLHDHYVRQLVRSLDLAARYQALLIDTLAPGREGVAQRQAVFARQWAPQLLEQALQARLKGQLGETAHAYLKHVIDSPDAKAREPFGGVNLVFRDLAFRAVEGRHPDVALGMYLIGPASLEAGPQILYVLYSQDYVLMEFRHAQALLVYLQQTLRLQALVLQRLPPHARIIYAHHGFAEPHIGYVDPTLSSPAQANPPATLVAQGVDGNLLHRLYGDTYQLRLEQAKNQSHSVAESDWASLQYLLSLLADIALLVLPGRLSMPLMVWQGEAGLQAAVEASADDRWGQALLDFANGLLMIEAARASFKPAPAARLAQSFSGAPGPEQLHGLRPYIANHVSLADLSEDVASGFFAQRLTGERYIALDGRVFRVVAWRDRWRIYIGEGRDGPLVKRNDRQRWVLDPDEPLLGGGQVLGRQADPSVESIADIRRTITASGMRSIERLHPAKAQVIRQAHEQAIGYLSDCQAHLQSVASASELGDDARLFLQRIFSVDSIEQRLLDKLMRASDEILTLLQSPAFSPLKSTRYHLYSPPWPNRFAQVVKLGTLVKHRAVLFAPNYFAGADEIFRHPVNDRAGRDFDRVRHSTAAILIHELSHAALHTLDINYLSTNLPFLELLVPEPQSTGTLRRIKQQLQDNRYMQLSTSIPRRDLFKEKYINVRRYRPLEPRLAEALMQRARCATIEQVQDRFASDPVFREDVILMNADSLTLLITWLGYFKPASGGAASPSD